MTTQIKNGWTDTFHPRYILDFTSRIVQFPITSYFCLTECVSFYDTSTKDHLFFDCYFKDSSDIFSSSFLWTLASHSHDSVSQDVAARAAGTLFRCKQFCVESQQRQFGLSDTLSQKLVWQTVSLSRSFWEWLTLIWLYSRTVQIHPMKYRICTSLASCVLWKMQQSIRKNKLNNFFGRRMQTGG